MKLFLKKYNFYLSPTAEMTNRPDADEQLEDLVETSEVLRVLGSVGEPTTTDGLSLKFLTFNT